MDAPSTATAIRRPPAASLGVTGLVLSLGGFLACASGVVGFVAVLTDATLDLGHGPWLYFAAAGALGLFPSLVGLAAGVIYVVLARRSDSASAIGLWAVALGAFGPALMALFYFAG